VSQPHRRPVWVNQEHRYAVRESQEEDEAGGVGDQRVDARYDPAAVGAAGAENGASVYLLGINQIVELDPGLRAEGAPPLDHLLRLVADRQAEVAGRPRRHHGVNATSEPRE
jgi:hypothetical protein